MNRRHAVVLAFCLVLTGTLFAGEKDHSSKAADKSMPVTGSPKARELYNKGIQDYENLYLERCNEDWRAAVKEDPNLALAWAWIAFNSRNPAEVTSARQHAKALIPKVTTGEPRMIQ